MQRLRSFSHFLAEASSHQIQTLTANLQSEADSAKMRIGGTEDKLQWAMDFVVLTAFIQQMQKDLANGTISAPNYAEDLFNNIEGQSTILKSKAIELLKINGLSDEAAKKLEQTPVEAEETEAPEQAQPKQQVAPVQVPESKSYDGESLEFGGYINDKKDPKKAAKAYLESAKRLMKNDPKGAKKLEKVAKKLNEAKEWSLVQVVPNSLKVEKQVKRKSKPKSETERDFRTAFNHTRNEIRKVLEPKPVEKPAQPAPQVQPNVNPSAPSGV